MTRVYHGADRMDPLRHNRGLLERAELGLQQAREIFKPGGMTQSALANAGDKLEGLDVALKQVGCHEPTFPVVREAVLVGHCLGRLLKALWKAQPVEEIGRDQEWCLPEFLAPLYRAAEEQLQRFEGAVYDWREELGACDLREAA